MNRAATTHWVGALVGAAALAWPTAGLAQSGDKAAAEALFQKGREAMAAGNLDTACAAFEESNRLDPAPGTLANQASCEEARGHLAVAWQLYEQATAKLPTDDPRREVLVQRGSALEARLPFLTIRLDPDAPPHTRVVRDSVELRSASLGVALPTDPGFHRIEVSAPGRSSKRYAIELSEKEQKELVVVPGAALEEKSATPPPVTAPAPAAPSGARTTTSPPPTDTGASHADTRTLGFVIGGVGVAGIGTAFVLGGLALGKKSTMEDHCDSRAHTCDSQEGLDAASSAKTLTTVSNVCFLLGAAATGAGAYFVLTSGNGKETTSGVVAVAGGSLAVVRGRF